ncbi:AMP-binding protein [Candidatus Falkowbacteria bacterium]|nr:AMP-binding protein [Candidatus Falkowbacteria bacterium]
MNYNFTKQLEIESKDSEKTAIFFNNQKISYQDLMDNMHKYSCFFKKKLLAKQKVLIILKDSPAFIYCILSLCKLGVIPVLVNYNISSDNIKYIINSCKPSSVISTTELIKKINPKSLKGVKIYNLDRKIPKEIKQQKIIFCPYHFNKKNDPAIILCTSGTTGNPKLVVHSHNSYIFCAKNFALKTLKINKTDRIFSCSKMFFAYGFGNSLVFPLYIGASVILSNQKSTSAEIKKIVNKFHPTIFFAVPTIYMNFLNQKRFFLNVKNIRMFLSAGEHLPIEMILRWQMLTNKIILDGIGATEMANTFIANTAKNFLVGATGKLVTGYKSKIIKNKKNCNINEIGELVISGESMFLGYLVNNKLIKNRFNWFKTSDLFLKNNNGYFFYKGRKNELFKKNAQWISAIEVENCLISLKFIIESAVVQNPDNKEIIAFITTKKISNKTELKNKIKQKIKNELGKNKIPDKILFVKKIPKTTTGKKQKFILIKDLTK